MPRPVALHLALDLARTPTLGSIVQREPLPDGVIDVIKIAAGDAETTTKAVSLTRERPETIRNAAAVYLQTALFTPRADNYRMLGVQRTAKSDEIRRHLRWLMMWLHPDRQHDEWQSKLAESVLGAWDTLKTPERRADYDRAHPPLSTPPGRKSRRFWRRPWLPWVEWPKQRRQGFSVWLPRLAAGIGIGIVALTVVVVGSALYQRQGMGGPIDDVGDIVEAPLSTGR